MNPEDSLLNWFEVRNETEAGLPKVALKDVDAVAVTVKPGLPVCLKIGAKYALNLCRTGKKPIIPVHHMLAHAVTIRLVEDQLSYPFLTLLMSGGHCILALANSVSEFLVFGNSLDVAPGEAFDKVARRLQLCHVHPTYENLSGGVLIEKFSADGDPFAFEFPYPLRVHDCNFSFSGLMTKAYQHLTKLEATFGSQISDDKLKDLSASFQHAIFRHIAKRLLRAFQYINERHLMPNGHPRYLVLSGGVASNAYIRKGLAYVAERNDFALLCPPKELCTDNGIMIAWCGVEKFIAGEDILYDLPERLEVFSRYAWSFSVIVLNLIAMIIFRVPLGKDISQEIAALHIPASYFKLSLNFSSM
ncbi:unnamed protein product [Soboliphyme baturini]|uniref:N(6)-L-threonylcarbamoyladenine synthase n=1 Tax=Soboliphyme baturini TaxID=241478 RepID=A0A183ITH8_9BILA|nr:unnamed protein product [Soboliphyme baturini]